MWPPSACHRESVSRETLSAHLFAMLEQDIWDTIAEVLDRNEDCRLDEPNDKLALLADLQRALVALLRNH